MIDADQAAEIALRHGLGIHDALSLRGLAEDVETAERIAKRFARGGGDQLVRDLFGTKDAPELDEPVEGNNHVAREGTTSPAVAHDDARQVAADLFNR